MGLSLETSLEELETALLEYLAPKMPTGIVLEAVEMESLNRFSAWMTGDETVRDLEALAEAFRVDIMTHRDPEGKTILAIWVRVALLQVRFEIYFATEEERAAAMERFR